jgi:hypothetical protein
VAKICVLKHHPIKITKVLNEVPSDQELTKVAPSGNRLEPRLVDEELRAELKRQIKQDWFSILEQEQMKKCSGFKLDS